MKKRLAGILSVMMVSLTACSGGGEVQQEAVSDDTAAVVQETVNTDTPDAEEVDEAADVAEVVTGESKAIKYISMADLYDYDSDASLERGIRTIVNDADEENEFLDLFIIEQQDMDIIQEGGSTAFVGTVGDDNLFVFLAPIGDEEYPKYAYGFRYSINDAQTVAAYDPEKTGDDIYDSIVSSDGSEFEYAEYMKPLLDYQDKEYVYNANEEPVNVIYSADPEKYGTYNSSGVLYYDSESRPLYRDYYVTNGGRISYYFYDENGLSMYFDFGGMAYKGMDSNPDIEIGVDMDVYIFER